MVAHQLQHLPGVVDNAVRDEEEEPWVALVHRLPDDPLEWGKDVGATHVGAHPLDVVTGQGQALLLGEVDPRVTCGMETLKHASPWIQGQPHWS